MSEYCIFTHPHIACFLWLLPTNSTYAVSLSLSSVLQRISERGSADELLHDGVVRNGLLLHRFNQGKEHQEPRGNEVGAGILRFDGLEQRFRILAQDGRLVNQARVEEHVRLFLARENVLLLPFPHGRPGFDGLEGVVAAEFIVPDHAPQQAHIRRMDAVVVIDGHGRQSADEDLQLVLRRNGFARPLVQGVDAFDDEDAVVLHPHQIALVFPYALLEVELGQFDFRPLQQFVQVVVEERHVDGVDALVVIRTVSLLRRLVPVQVIVVHGDGDGLDAVHFELDAQALGERRLARRRRAGNEDEAREGSQ